MATYINGVTDFIPQIQEFQPDFNFYGKSLQMSQGKYDANHEKLSNLYGSLLNSPMLRDKNIEQRDSFFKVVDQDIKRMAGMDLSKQQNVDSASSIFNQLLDNKSIVKDMVWTKNWQNEHQRADGFRNCVDPKKCGGAWWEGGITALNYQADEFKKADDNEAMNFASAQFTPYQDVMGKAIELAKAADLNIKVDTKSGGYIVTTKNGANIIKPLASLFMGTLGKDPAIMEYYKTKAYVDRKGWINGNIDVYGSEEAASQAYIKQATQTVAPELSKTEQNLLYNQSSVAKQKKTLEDEIKKNGTTYHSTLADTYRKMVGTEQDVNSSVETIQDATGNMRVAVSNASKSALRNLDNALASAYLQTDIGNAAQTLAYKDYEQTMAADPYALENVRQANRLALEDKSFQNKAALEEYKFNLTDLHNKIAARGDATANTGILVEPGAGDVTANTALTATYDQFMKEKTKVENAISQPEKEMLISMMTLAVTASNNGDAGADADLLSMGDALMNKSKSDNPTAYSKYTKASPEQKLKAIKSMNFANSFQTLSGSTADDMYQDVLVPLMNPNIGNNKVTRKYLSQLWTTEGALEKRNRITAKNTTLTELDKYYVDQTQSVKAKIKEDSNFNDYTTAIDAYIDLNGNPKTQKQFVTDYMQQAVKHGNPQNKKQIALNAYSEANELYTNMNTEEGVLTKWKEAFSTYSVAKGQTNALHGGGSQAAKKALNFPTTDPAEYTSTGTMAFNTFMNDVTAADPTQMRMSFGAPGAAIPETNAIGTQEIIHQLVSDMRKRNKATDNTRPIINQTYHDVAGSNDDWTALNVKIDPAYAKQYIGSKDAPGILYGKYEDMITNGITVYLKKDAAENTFRKNAATTDIETILHYTKQYPIDDFPKEAKDVVVKNLDNGGYILSGSAAYDINDKGDFKYQPFEVQYADPNTDINKVISLFRDKFLQSTVKTMAQKEMQYNLTHGIKDPEQLLN